MVVVYGYGKDPMVLLTNKRARKKGEVLSILKAYITRWRIEEMFRVQKQEFQLEGIRVRSLKRLNLLFLLVSTLITFMTLKIEKKNGFFHAVIKRERKSTRLNSSHVAISYAVFCLKKKIIARCKQIRAKDK